MEAQMIVAARARAGRLPVPLSLVGDERLARLVAGDGYERAFATLYERYHQPVFRYCRSMLRNDADAQDALQSALVGAFAALRRGQRDAPLRPWLFRIAHNESVSLLRRRRPDCELSEASEISTVSVEARVEERARLAGLVADLRELPERQRSALVMRELSDLSHEEIAVALGASVGAAKQTIFEARRSLSEFAEGRAMACEEIRRTISDGDGRALRGRRVRAHLRDCSGCALFAAAIPARGATLRAIAPPLPAVAAVGLLARVLGGSSGHGGGSAGGLAAAAAGKAVGATFAAKALAGVAIVATATAAVGVTGALRDAMRPPPAPRDAQVSQTVDRVGLGSPGFARRAIVRSAARGSGVDRGAARIASGMSARRADRAVAASGASGVANGGGRARALSSADAPGASRRGVRGARRGNGGSRAGAHRRAQSASAPAVGWPSTTSAGRPSTPTTGGNAPGLSAVPATLSPSAPRVRSLGTARSSVPTR